ncbi:limonene-1,2-epoxide hydrolase family protein [Rhodococcus opacus]|uniref:limonene-1,2-epoxide hydrolase family protein n=1 Tax=Rhodococcus opacus TaxID=37919 RepID=UPI0015FF8358|nr:limonene-1,2-epoxide hydrolase family protein [Rhodococcus opacus]QZS52474.1 nuclear transport factor 2 family protein [Rhodococcus opacus]
MPHTGHTAEEAVAQYFAALGPTADHFWASFDKYFDEQTVWENVGLARTVGRDEAVAFARAFPVPFDHMRVDDVLMSSSSNKVLTGRVDHFCAADGTPLLTIRVAGVLEIADGRLIHWRDYFDTAKLHADLEKLLTADNIS